MRCSILLLLALAVLPLRAEQALAPLSGRDEAFSVSIEIKAEKQGPPACFAYVESAFKKDPRPHVKSCYGEFLIYGQAWGAPDGRAAEGLKLVQEAQAEGSANATRILAWLSISGSLVPQDVPRGLAYLRQACDAGQVEAIAIMGQACRKGIGMLPDIVAAEKWLFRAACEGKPKFLDDLAGDYEKGSILFRPNLTKACQLYYQAHLFGQDRIATANLQRLADAGVGEAARTHHLAVLWDTQFGKMYTTKLVKDSMEFLVQGYPDDADALVALGRVYRSGNYYKDNKKAAGLFQRAAAKGSDDARCELAEMLAEGIAMKKDPAAALVILRALEAKNHPGALRLLGYYHYWGSLKGTEVTKDPAKAYAYIKRAAAAGELYGQIWLGTCYEFGIGTEVNYGLAARYFHAAGVRGVRQCYFDAMKLVDHAK